MRKIRLSDTDVELFDIEISPSEFNFYQRHKDAFRTMWKEQGKPFWTKYVITFRSFTVKHGVIKQMNIDSPKFENLIDQAFIFIHEQFVDGKERMAKNFLEDIARLAQNQDKFPALDSKSFAKDPFYLRETRELFRSFFGMPDQKSSYLKVYILCPVFMRFGGSVCRCLEKWLLAPIQDDPSDDSYWTPPQPQIKEKCEHSHCIHDIIMCGNCIDDCGQKFFDENVNGHASGPKSLHFWKLGDPRFNDPCNPLFAPHVDPKSDWRDSLTAESFREFLFYAKCKYGSVEDKCGSCIDLRKQKEKILKMTECQNKNKKNEREVDLTQLEEFRILRDQLDFKEFKEIDFEHCTEETALNLSEKLLNLAKDHWPEHRKDELGEEETKLKHLQKMKKKEKKRQKKKARAQAHKKESCVSKDKGKAVESESTDEEEDAVGGFKIVRDEKKGIVSVTVTTSKESKYKKNGLQNGTKLKGLPDGVSLNIDLIRQQIDGIPKLFEFWEGTGYLIAVLNYGEDERDECEKPTNFTIKVSGVSNKLHENIIVKLLFYVTKRKKRKALGWNMDADDVVACIFPDEDPELAGLEVTIIRGNFFKAKLSKKERASLRQSIAHKKVLMMLEPSVAKEIRESANGRERVRSIIAQVCNTDSKRDRMFRCDQLWEKLIYNPDKFDFVLTVNSARVEELKKIGLRPLDVGYDELMKFHGPAIAVCRHCFRSQCECGPNSRDLFDPEWNHNGMRIIPGNQAKDIGNWTADARRESKEEKLETELDAFIKAKLLEIARNPDLSELKVTYDEPATMPNKKLVPGSGMSGNINLSFKEGLTEQTISVQLEAYMPEDDINDGEDVLRNIRREFQRNYSPDEAVTAKTQELIEKATGQKWCEKHGLPNEDEPKYCEKHKPSAQKNAPANENSPAKQKSQLATVGLTKKMQTSPEKISSSTFEPSKQTAIPMPYHKIFKEETSSSSKAENVVKSESRSMSPPASQGIVVDLNKLCLVSTASDNRASENEVKSASEKSFSAVTENKLGEICEVAGEISSSTLANGNSCNLEEPDDRSMNANMFLASATKEMNWNEEKSEGDDNSKECDERTDQDAEKADKEEKSKDENGDKQTLKVCRHCGLKEPRRKAFKKCQKCKEEGVKNVRYYCGRECQVEDWRLKHKAEHRDSLLG